MTPEYILRKFITEHNKTWRDMNAVDHSYLGKAYNAYHLEGTVWTHTMMVLKEAQNASNVMMLSALMHDIGKAYVWKDIDKTERRRFSSHEAVSTFYAKELLETTFKDNVDVLEKSRILFIVANHGSMYNFFEGGRIPLENYQKMLNRYSYTELEDLIEFYKYDHNGRFHLDESNGGIYDDFEDIIALKMKEPEDQTIVIDKKITVLVGPPRVGKSTWVKENSKNSVVISRDAYVESDGVGSNYSEKWQSLTQAHQKEIDAKIMKDFNTAIKNQQDIIIDMTNMSKKSRKRWLQPKGYTKIVKVFIESKSCLLSRNTPDKFISEEVIDRMLSNFVWPLSDEGFDVVNVL